MYNFKNLLKVYSTKKEEVFDESIGAFREKHQIKITNLETKVSKYFTFTTQVIDYIESEEKVLEDALYCVFQDYKAYDFFEDVEEFCWNFGYELEEGTKIHKATKKNWEKFQELLDEEDEIILAIEEHYEGGY